MSIYRIVLKGEPSSNRGGLNVSVEDFSDAPLLLPLLLLLLLLLLNLVDPLPPPVPVVGATAEEEEDLVGSGLL